MQENNEKSCSFCGRPESYVEHLVAGPGIYICDNCIENAQVAINYEAEQLEQEMIEDLMVYSPAEIKAELDKQVIGQDHAKRILAVAVYNHYKRLLNTNSDIEIVKNNVLLIGSTGTGKTLLAKTLAKVLDLPFAIADATSLTEAGYIGEDVETILTRLLDSANGNVKLAERGIIYIDEVDKISRRSNADRGSRDVAGEGVQQALLKIMEGTDASVPLTVGRRNTNTETVIVNTSNILFILGGAFPGIENIIKKRYKNSAVGFDIKADVKAIADDIVVRNVNHDDAIEYGLIPEFMGRISNIAPLDPLRNEDLVSILTKPQNALIKQYKRLLDMDGIELKFDKSAVSEIAEIALKKNTGARGLNTIIESLMLEVMYEAPDEKGLKQIKISKKAVLGLEKPKRIYDGSN